MKRITNLVLLVGALLSSLAWGINGNLENERGTIWISDAGIVSRGSQLVFCDGLVPRPGGSLGSLSFVVGPLLSGSLETGGTFSSSGSSFTVIGRCGKKDESRGVVFQGVFEGELMWTLVSAAGQELTFELSGLIRGTNRRGRKVGGQTSQIIVTTKDQLAKGIGHILSGAVVWNT